MGKQSDPNKKLDRAIMRECSVSVRQALRDGVCFDAIDDRGRPYAFVTAAAYGGKTEILEILIKSGGDINENLCDWRGTPLHAAVTEGKVDTVKYLIRHGAALNATDSQGNTPLHDAVSNRQIDCIYELIAAGADKSVKNMDDKTPLDLAESKGDRGILCILANLPGAPTDTWQKTGDAEITHSYDFGTRRLTETFNFRVRECITFARNIHTEAESMTRNRFEDMPEDIVAEAAEKLEEIDGGEYTARAVKKKPPMRIG